jgi:hypothetical protein
MVRIHPAPRILNTASVLLLLLIPIQIAWAGGGYTSAGSRAMADSNAAGDLLLAGDTKILVRRGPLEKAFSIAKESAAEPSVVTGGLLKRNLLEEEASTIETKAVVCVENKLVVLSIQHDGTSHSEVTSLKKSLSLNGSRDLRCAVNKKTGEWLALNIRDGRALSNQGSSFTLPRISAAWSHVLHSQHGFLVLGERGNAVIVSELSESGRLPNVKIIKSPWPDLQNRDSLAIAGQSILRAGEDQVSLVTLIHDAADGMPSWSEFQKISLNPCSENGGCGVWMAENDQRWIVAGAWGTFVGRGKNFSRIKAPLLISDATTPGVALVPSSGKYVLVGDIDSDIGLLPQEVSLERFTWTEKRESDSASRERNQRRFIVWLKTQYSGAQKLAGESRALEHLFSYQPHTVHSARSADVVIHSGPMPSRWPSHWAAVEPEISFDALTLSNEWTPLTGDSAQQLPKPQPPWWVVQMGFAQSLSLIQQKNIQPSQIRVGVIDSGVDLSHPALKDVFDVNADEIPDNGVDDDKNGLIDDVVGYDFVTESAAPLDSFGHGTHVAGLLHNAWSGEGTLGGAFNAKLRIFRALDSSGKSNSIDLSRALAAAIKSKVDLVNCSWGGGPETQVLRDAFAAAAQAGVIVFSSAGNDGININDAPPVPKRFTGVISVGASNPSKARARFSNWGSQTVLLFAPGTEITSTLPSGQLGEKSGTSMASPIAASVSTLTLGLIRAMRPEWSKEQQKSALIELLCEGSDRNQLAGTSSRCGLLNAHRTLTNFFKGEP